MLLVSFTPTSKYDVRKVSEVLRSRPFVIFAAEKVSNCHLKTKASNLMGSPGVVTR